MIKIVRLMTVVLLVVLSVSSVAYANVLMINDIPDCYAGDTVYIGGMTTKDIEIKVYQPGKDEVWQSTTLESAPDTTFSWNFELPLDVTGKYKIEAKNSFKKETITFNVTQKPVKNEEVSDNILDGIKVVIGGKTQNYHQAPVIQNNRTLVPMKETCEALGASSLWDDKTQTVTITKNTTKIKLVVGDTNAAVNDNKKNLDQFPVMINNVIFIPVRFVSESLGANVSWDEAAKTVAITLE